MHDKAQLTVAILLWFLSLIPNNALRYALLAIVASLALLYAIHLRRPSTQLSQLEHFVQKTEGTILDAKLHCARDLGNLLEKWVELLKIKRSASKIQSRMLETNALTWKNYRLLSHDISDCADSVKEIRTAVQLIVEAERQRKYTDDINETEVILTTVRSPRTCSFIDTIFRMRISNLTFTMFPAIVIFHVFDVISEFPFMSCIFYEERQLCEDVYPGSTECIEEVPDPTSIRCNCS
ncbi:hypothetical protein FB451DRAFT_1389279 [Mycena latifolia]|nr:hypothetical protein FB451DRAFT_1389279 [Mycena latifolia]